MAALDPCSIATLRHLGECWAFCHCGHRGVVSLDAIARRHGWGVPISRMQRALRCEFCRHRNPAWIVVRLAKPRPKAARPSKRPPRDSDQALLEWKRYEALLALGPPDLAELRRRAVAQLDYFAMVGSTSGLSAEGAANARAIIAFCDSLQPREEGPSKTHWTQRYKPDPSGETKD